MLTAIGILIPFVGTTLGAAGVFFMKNQIKPIIQKSLLGFASGVMVAASVWSLLLPAIDRSSWMEKLAFIPAAAGFVIGIAFLYALDKIIPHLHIDSNKPEGSKGKLKKTTMLVLAVTLHNIPEGMAVGAVFASLLSGEFTTTVTAAFALSIGIGIQNFPEGAIISLPLRSEGESRSKAFLHGTLSGIVEPLFATLTVALTSIIVPALPYFLSFAAGAMIFVVVEELLPDASEGKYSDAGTIGFAIGFLIMMVLDVALG